MSYGIKYQCTFDPIGVTSVTPVYTLQILQKDYAGDVTDVVGTGTLVIQSYATDEPKAPIKGSSLSINLVNDGILPLSTFFSIEADEYQVKLFWDAQLMWIGYLVQADFSELLVDPRHEINLSANDNLGLLKDVALDKAKITYTVILNTNDTHETTAPHTLTVSPTFAASVQNGDRVTVFGLIFTTIYTVVDNSGVTDLIVAETVSTVGVATDDMDLTRPSQFPDKVTIATVLQNCLAATNLQIDTHLFCNFLEVNQDPAISFIEQTLLDTQTFLKDTQIYYDCYKILSDLMARLNSTLFQAKGVWNIVHWDELRYSSNEVPGYAYDSDFTLIGPIKLNDDLYSKFLIEPFNPADVPDLYPETGLFHRLWGPLEFAQETFNYKQPAQLLRNFDLQTLGNLLDTYTTGSGPTLKTFNEYAVPWWYDAYVPGGSDTVPAVFFIRVIQDNFGNEIERYIVVEQDNIISYKIEVNEGDIFRFSYSWRTKDSSPGVVGYTILVKLIDGVETRFVREPGGGPFIEPGWAGGPGWSSPILAGDNTNIWHTINIECQPIPFNGLLYVFLPTISPGFSDETWYRDIRFEYIASVNGSTKIIGQQHQTIQAKNTKQNEDKEIFIDDSPRNSIAGTLFLPTLTGLLYDRTSQWFLNDPGDTRKLGDLTTFETLFWRRIVRSILEGTLRGLISADTGGDHISMLSVFNCSLFPDLNYIWGKLDIDYKNNKSSGTLWEIYDEGEVDADLDSTYEFKYLYALK